MGQTEIIIALATVTITITVLVAGIVMFIIQYRKRKIEHTKETEMLNEKHTQDLLEKQLETQLLTMQHIGTEIHDNVGQKLTLASLYTKQLSIKTITNLDEKVNAISTIIDESLSELRQLSKTLTNPQLADAGLLFLLNEEARRVNASGVCFINIDSNKKEIILPQAEKNILFRLLQEFIQNSLKHSGCRKITISFLKENDYLKITATDDGRGFDTNATSYGIGLQNMRRRAGQINATYEMNSEAGKGTSIILQLQTNLP